MAEEEWDGEEEKGGRGQGETDGQDVLFPEHIQINGRRRHSLAHILVVREKQRRAEQSGNSAPCLIRQKNS